MSSPAAPTATMNGSRCSSRGCAARAEGADSHAASSLPRSAGLPPSNAPLSHASNSRDGPYAARTEELAQVVIAQSAADDQHAFVAQRRDRAAQGQVGLRIQPPLERQLHHGHVGFRVDHLERREGAMVKTALRVEPCGQSRRVEQCFHARRQRPGLPARRSGCGRCNRENRRSRRSSAASGSR